MKKIGIIFITFSICIFSFSQTSIYILGGTTNGIKNSSLSNSGYTAGVLFDLPIKGKWSFQTGLNFNLITLESNAEIIHHIGKQDKIFDEGYISNYHFTEIPTSLSYKLKLNSQIGLRINSGLYFGLFSGGTSLLRSSKGFSDYSLVHLSASPIHLGLCIGTGIDIKNLYLGIEINSNLTDGYSPDGAFKTLIGFRF